MHKITQTGWLLLAVSIGIGWLIGDSNGAVVGFVAFATLLAII